tara:strand:- start:859 stop:1041 length:183 start_codon:yes stop_codon:yes gene_type:complete
VKLKARVSILLELDEDEFPMPVDGDPTEELEDMLEEVLEHLDGTQVLNLKIKCTGGRIDD